MWRACTGPDPYLSTFLRPEQVDDVEPCAPTARSAPAASTAAPADEADDAAPPPHACNDFHPERRR